MNNFILVVEDLFAENNEMTLQNCVKSLTPKPLFERNLT